MIGWLNMKKAARGWHPGGLLVSIAWQLTAQKMPLSFVTVKPHASFAGIG